MSTKVTRSTKRNSVLTRVINRMEYLEPRAYLAGVVFQSPGVSTSAASAGIAPTFATLFDFNGDGKADLVTANGGSNTVSVLLSNGDGTFHTPANTITVGTSPLPLAVDRINNDANYDIITGNTGTVSVVLGNGDGTFQAAQNIPALTHNDAIATGDFNGDGRVDIVTVNHSANAAANDRVAILFQNADGSFTMNPMGGITHTGIAAVAVKDLNGDGKPDIAFVDQFDNKVTVILNNGNGTFASPVDYNTGSGPTSIVVDTFNSDNHPDIVTANSTGGNVSFLANSGTGTFPAAPVNSAVQGSATGGGPLKVRLTNINNDNINDLIVLDSTGSSADATVLLGNGNGTFHTGTLIATHGARRTSIATGDINGDGLTDAVVADPTNVTALLNITNSDTTPPTASVPSVQPAAVAGATAYQFTVTYTDNAQVDAATLGNGNITVTGPNGFSQAATLVSQNLGNAPSVTATYQIGFPSGLSSTNNGTYTVTTTSDPTAAVKDANGNPVAGGAIGSLSLSVTTTPQPGASPIDIITLVKKLTLKAGKGKTLSFPRYNFPAGANGAYFLMVSATSPNNASLTISGVSTKSPAAVVAGSRGKPVRFTVTNSGGTIDSKDIITFKLIASPTGGANATSSAILISPAFVDLAAQSAVLPVRLPIAGRKSSILVSVLNSGNVAAKGVANATITFVTGGVAGTPIVVPVKISIPAGKVRRVKLTFVVPALASGTYSATVNLTPVSGFTDSNSANDTVTTSNTVTR